MSRNILNRHIHSVKKLVTCSITGCPFCVCVATQQSLRRSGIEENLCVSAWRVVLISRWPLDLLTSNIKYIYILCWTEENKKKKRKFSVRYPFTTGDMTGAYSVHTIYEGHEIMFHVSTLLSYSKDNKTSSSSTARSSIFAILFYFILYYILLNRYYVHHFQATSQATLGEQISQYVHVYFLLIIIVFLIRMNC